MPRPKIVIEGDSEEAVALGLLEMVMQAEGAPRDRAGILAAYRECLAAVRGGHAAPPALPAELRGDEADEGETESEAEEDAGPAPIVTPEPVPHRRRKYRDRS